MNIVRYSLEAALQQGGYSPEVMSIVSSSAFSSGSSSFMAGLLTKSGPEAEYQIVSRVSGKAAVVKTLLRSRNV